MSSIRLKQLVAEVLKSGIDAKAENVIEEVFVAIEANPGWSQTYKAASYGLGKDVAPAWAGFWIAHLTQRVGDERETAARTTLIESFTRLVGPAATRGKKVKEPDAVAAMHEHFIAHRDSLPGDVRTHRDVIVALIMDGLTPQAAFAAALEKPMFAWR